MGERGATRHAASEAQCAVALTGFLSPLAYQPDLGRNGLVAVGRTNSFDFPLVQRATGASDPNSVDDYGPPRTPARAEGRRAPRRALRVHARTRRATGTSRSTGLATPIASGECHARPRSAAM